MRTGECIKKNVGVGSPPFHQCGGYDFWSDAGIADADTCFLPSIHAMKEIYEAYPRATILMVVRDTKDWVRSMTSWRKGKLLKKMIDHCTIPGFSLEEDNLEMFYEWHTESVRKFVREHPSLTYIEVPLESPETATFLEERIGIPNFCWRHCHPDQTPSYCPRENTTAQAESPYNF
jgi:hypothetical protein